MGSEIGRIRPTNVFERARRELNQMTGLGRQCRTASVGEGTVDRDRWYARARLSATEMRLWPPFQKHLLSDGPPSGEICPEIQDINLGIHNEFRTLDRDSINAGGCLGYPAKVGRHQFRAVVQSARLDKRRGARRWSC